MSRFVTPTAAAVGVLVLVVATACGWLGWWQWTRAHASTTVNDAAPVDIATVLSPAASADGAIGVPVVARGEFSGQGVVVTGRDIDGRAVDVVVRHFVVDSAHTGTGEQASLAVVVGYRAESPAPVSAAASGERELVGYLQSSEAPALNFDSESGVPGWATSTSISTADFARLWPSPMYSAVLVSNDESADLVAMPARRDETSLSLQSLVYAFEWWLFAAFAVVIGIRWIRENGREERS